jgi:hypothetical protein
MSFTQVTSGLIASVANTSITGNIISSQITSVSNTQISGLITGGQIATVGTSQLTGQITSSQITNTGVTSGNYGGSSTIPVLNINSQGQVVSASNTSITIPASVAQGNGAIIINSTTISTSYTLTANNGLSVGPITISPGNTVTISPSQRWLII